MQHKGLIITLAIVVVLGMMAFFVGMFSYLIFSRSSRGMAIHIGKGIGVITVSGTIISADETIEEIKNFIKDNDVKAVVFRIESPGGSVAASQEIMEAIKRMATKKPVIASMGSVAASGGYYVACGATKIIANPGTMTGSIGVRLEHLMIGDLLKWAKIEHETLKSGKYKDIGSMDRPMTPEERALLEGMLIDIHEQFKEDIMKSRNISREELDKIADGRVFTGRQALEYGLVDGLGGFSESVKIAANLVGLTEDADLIYPKKANKWLERLFGSETLLERLMAVSLKGYWMPLLMAR